MTSLAGWRAAPRGTPAWTASCRSLPAAVNQGNTASLSHGSGTFSFLISRELLPSRASLPECDDLTRGSYLRTFTKVIQSRQAEVSGAVTRHMDTVSNLLIVHLSYTQNRHHAGSHSTVCYYQVQNKWEQIIQKLEVSDTNLIL